MVSSVLFSSAKEEWETPQSLFDELNEEFSFILDACASYENAKCTLYYTKEADGLLQDWSASLPCTPQSVWVNPPYGRDIGHWVKKAAESTATVVMLLPARTDTRWFHDYIYKKPGVEIRFLRGRLKFSNAKHSAPFPSMIVIFRGNKYAHP